MSDDRRRAFEDAPPRADLPREIAPSVTRWDVVKVAVTAMAIVVVANIVAAVYLQTSEIALIATKWTMLLEPKSSPSWFVVGDSTCNQGVDPQVWSETFGPTVNLCTIANATVADGAWMLQHIEDQRTPLDGVLVVHAFDVWPREFPPRLLADYPLQWGFWSQQNPPVHPAPSQLLEIFTLRYVPLYSRSGRLANVGELRQTKEENAEKRRALTPGVLVREDGFMPWPYANDARRKKDVKETLQMLGAQEFQISEYNRVALEEIGRYAERTGTKVVLATAPLYEGVARSPLFVPYKAALDAELRAFADRYERVEYVSEIFEVSAGQAELVDHVTHEAARDFTEWLRAIVQERLRLEDP